MFSRKESAHGWCYLITNYILTGERDSNEGILIRQLLSFSQVTMLKLNQLLPPPPHLNLLVFCVSSVFTTPALHIRTG